LRARDGGVLRRPGHTEAAVDLARLAALRPAGVPCEVVSRWHVGQMARRDELAEFAAAHGLALITIAGLIAYRRRHEGQGDRVADRRRLKRQLERVAEALSPTELGEFRGMGYRSAVVAAEQLALVYGQIGDGRDVLVRVQSECLTGDVFGSLRCGCGP